jgi:hypothetical protein
MMRIARPATLGLVVGAAVLLVIGGSAQAGVSRTITDPTTAPASSSKVTLQAVDDAYLATEGRTLAAKASVLDNDRGRITALTSHTDPAHGTLTLKPDGTFKYQPAAGFTGLDTFTYTVSNAVTLYKTKLPPLATIGGVKITGGAYGSSLYPVPGSKDEVYGLTDRGPNVTAPDGSKIEPIPTFDPAIGKFKLSGGVATLERVIPLRAGNGTPYNGAVNTQAGTGENMEDLTGNMLPPSPYGYDSEGLVALPDGTFWVSDEYGPFITHFDGRGRQIRRLSPFDGSLPVELGARVPNKGMEGLTITPDGRTLVGIMQSALQQPDLTSKPGNVAALRIVTYDLKTHLTHEYLYLLDDPKTNSGAVSEITALSPTRFLVDERDGNPEPGAYKKLFEIDLAGATDIGPNAGVTGALYDGLKGGLLIGAAAKTVEAYVGTDDTATATADLVGVGIKAVSKVLDVDLGALLTTLDPAGGFFGHDKIEGVATTDAGRTLVISNDSDFGIDGVTNAAPPYQLHAKLLPDGRQDDGEYLSIDTAKLTYPASTATVTIFVTPKDIHR